MKHSEPKQKVKFTPNKGQKTDYNWAIKTLVITFVLSASFNLFSTVLSQNAGILVAFIILLFIISVGIFFDLIGTAITTCEETSFHSMAARKISGAYEAITLIRNKDKAANFCCDIVGDICGIISGSCATAIIAYFASNHRFKDLLISLFITSVVAALTVSGKALFKTIAIKYNSSIVYYVAKTLSVFGFGTKKKI